MKRIDVLDTPLLRLTPWDEFRLRDAVQGVCILGGIGSGKTSGSGKSLAGAYLRAGMGGLVLCAKPEEVELWRSYCAQHGRSNSLIVFDGKRHGFNFLGYELARQGNEGLNAVIECLMRVLEMAKAASPTPGRAGDAFWEDTTRQILRNAIPVLFAATGTVRIADLLQFVRSAPRTADEMREPEWQKKSYFFECFLKAMPHLPDAVGSRVVGYWRDDFAGLDGKTRGNVVISLTTALDRFNHGWLRDAFCAGTSVMPEMTFHGAIVLLAMPALTLNEDGIIAQQLWKYMWQRAVLARNGMSEAQRERFVFLWADEAQYFLNSQDAEFLSTARGSRACTVFLSQSLPTFYAKMAGENARDRVHHLLGNFATRIWHNNACAETNEWAAKTIGRALQERRTYSYGHGSNQGTGMNRGENTSRGGNQGGGSSSSYGQGGGSFGTSSQWGSSWGEGENWGDNRSRGTTENQSWGTNEQMDYMFEPSLFSSVLKTGGPSNGNLVSAVWYQAGRRFVASSGNLLMPEFVQ